MNQHSGKILDWLYLGARINSTNIKELTVRTNIKYILNCAIELDAKAEGDFIYKKLELHVKI